MEHGDVAGAVRAITELAACPAAVRAAMGQRGKSLVEQELGKSILCGRFAQIIEAVLGARPPPHFCRRTMDGGGDWRQGSRPRSERQGGRMISLLCPRLVRPYWDRIDASPLGRRFVLGAFWSLAGATISRGLMLLSSIFVARMLGAEGFGQLGMLRSTVEMFGVFAGFGLGVTATKHVAQFRKADPLRAGRVIAMSRLVAWLAGGVMAIVLALIAPWLAVHALAAPQLGGLLRVGGLLLCSCAERRRPAPWRGSRHSRRLPRSTWSPAWLRFRFSSPAPILAAWTVKSGPSWRRGPSTGAEPRGAAAGIAAGRGSLWVCRLLAGRGHSLAIQPSRSSLRHAGRPRQLDLLRHARESTARLPRDGCLQRRQSVVHGHPVLPVLLGNVILPMLSHEVNQPGRGKSCWILRLSVMLNAWLVIPLVALGCLASPWIMAAYSQDFAAQWKTLVVVLVTAGLLAVPAPVAQVITAAGRLWASTLLNAVWAISFLAATVLFVGHGALGLAGARGIAYIVNTGCLWIFVRTLLDKKTEIQSEKNFRKWEPGAT